MRQVSLVAKYLYVLERCIRTSFDSTVPSVGVDFRGGGSCTCTVLDLLVVTMLVYISAQVANLRLDMEF